MYNKCFCIVSGYVCVRRVGRSGPIVDLWPLHHDIHFHSAYLHCEVETCHEYGTNYTRGIYFIVNDLVLKVTEYVPGMHDDCFFN